MPTGLRRRQAAGCRPRVGRFAGGFSVVSFRLLCTSTGFVRLVHTIHCYPTAGHGQPLSTFDNMLQSCFNHFTGLLLEPVQWQQATQGLSHAGLGLCSIREHATVAYLAFVGSSARLCSELDPGFWLDHSGGVVADLSYCNGTFPAAQHPKAAAAFALSQKQFSQRFDEAGCTSQLDGASPRLSGKLPFCLKLPLAPELSSLAPGAVPWWSHWFSLLNCGRGLVCPELARMHAVPNVTQCWTPTAQHSGMNLAGETGAPPQRLAQLGLWVGRPCWLATWRWAVQAFAAAVPAGC